MWALIIVIAAGTATTSNTNPGFKSKASCEKAISKLKETRMLGNDIREVEYLCVEQK